MSSALSLRHHFMRLPRKFAILLNVTIKNIQNAFHALNIGMVIYILHDLSGLLAMCLVFLRHFYRGVHCVYVTKQ